MHSGKFFASLTAIILTALASFAQTPITPDRPISLFNGKDLSAFDTWLVDYHREDPYHVFTVVDQIDGAPAIRVSGQHYGGLITKQRFTQYRLIAEFRWGSVTWKPRHASARDSGILLHCQGPYGNSKKDFNSPWMRSFEYQIIEGGTGDLLVLAGYDEKDQHVIKSEITCTTSDGKGKVWQNGGIPTVFSTGRIDWFGRDPKWADTLDFRGSRDVEKPAGQWNRAEIICEGATLRYFLNGVLVNEGTKASMQEGSILFQSEGAEIFFRRIEVLPLEK